MSKKIDENGGIRQLTWNDRAEKLLALLLLNQRPFLPDARQATMLQIAGFSTVEIADIMELRADQVVRLIHKPKKKGKRNGKKPRR